MEEKPTKIVYGTNIEHQENHVDIHDFTINGGNFYLSELLKKSEVNNKELPTELATPEAIRLLDLAKNQGWLDENYQPKGLIKVQMALLAGHICDLLWDKKKWCVFEKFWNQRTLASSFDDGLGSQNQQIFWNKVTDVIK